MTTSQPPLRIGDTERDSAASALSEHYASGRLSKAEYDDRLEAVWSAKYDADLGPLFADLPGPGPRSGLTPRRTQSAPQPAWAAAAGRHPRHVRLLWLAPVVLIGAVVAMAVILGAPWVLFIAFWLFICGGFGHSRGGFGHRRGYTRGHGHAPWHGHAGGHQHRRPV